MHCITPMVTEDNTTGRKKRATNTGVYSISFEMDELPISDFDILEFVPDPIFYPLNKTVGFDGVAEHHYKGTTLAIEVCCKSNMYSLLNELRKL